VAAGRRVVLTREAPAAPSIVPGIVTGSPRTYLLSRSPDDPATIGRDEGNAIRLKHPQVSRVHAAVGFDGARWTVTDLYSSNGTFVNDQPVTDPRPLATGDTLRISDYVFVFHETVVDGEARARLDLFSEEGNARVDAIKLLRVVPPRLVLLREVSLSIRPRELVAVVGGSGAGKSTLVNALSGFRPADGGAVLLNGVDFYKNLDSLRETLGFVPQDDIIHGELSVHRALFYAASLRLPEDTRRGEIHERIEQVLEDLQLTERRDIAIRRLSGGQRKRVSIGVELLNRPRLFFLDEPTSGLDPGLETEMMRTFRRLADQGHTVIVITHATGNIHLCDQMIFMARGGALAWYGPPAAALKHFGVSEFAEIYARVETEPSEEWERRYQASPQYRELVQERLDEVPPALMPRAAGPVITRQSTWGRALDWLRNEAFRRVVRRTDMQRQFYILTQRYAEITLRDHRNLLLMLLQAPIIAGLLAVVFPRDAFDLIGGTYVQAKTLLFLMVCCCIWFGTSNAAREICKEAAIWRRERSANLKIPPYVMSKVAVLSLLCVVQSAVMLGVIGSRIDLPDLGPVMLQKMFLILLMASLGGLAMGLLLSAIVNNPDKAQSLVPIVLIPQLVLAGALIPLKGWAADVGYLMFSKWAFEMIGQATRLEELPFFSVTGLDTPPDLLFQISFAGHFWVLVGYIGTLLALTCLAMRLKDRVE